MVKSSVSALNHFWKGKKVLITGHTGFKGSWLSILLSQLGADISGISLLPKTEPSLFNSANLNNFLNSYIFDLTDLSKLKKVISSIQPNVVFHLAAQPLVRQSYSNPIETINTNVIGTANLLESIRLKSDPKVALFISTDKVYKNIDSYLPFREEDKLGGHDPYSSSKAAAEIIIDSYKASFSEELPSISTIRAGNVIGGGDWSKDRILPDAIRSWEKGESLFLRNPKSVRPWQHVLEPIFGYVQIAQKQWNDDKLASHYNIGPSTDQFITVEELVNLAAKNFKGAKVSYLDSDDDKLFESKNLTIENAKARLKLNIKPIWTYDKAVIKTIDWHSKFIHGEKAMELCLQDINNYLNDYENQEK